MNPRAALLPTLVLVLAACHTSPATRAPLRDELAASDNPRIEDAAKSCLESHGWKVDPVGSVAPSGANVISAKKEKDLTEVYVQPPGVNPRVTGGPDDSDAFWRCLATELKGGGGESKDDEGGGSGDGGAPGPSAP